MSKKTFYDIITKSKKKGAYDTNHTNENMSELKEDEVFEKKEARMNPKLKAVLSSKKFLMGLIILIVIVVLGVLEWSNGVISNHLPFGYKMGNTVGNIVNCGYSVAKDNYIYYVAPSENMQNTNIYKVKKGTSDFEVIFQGSYDIRALNIVGNKIYFISISNEQTDDEDGIDNKICKINLDGSDFTVINDNEFAYDYYDMYAINNQIYYVGTDENVYQMDLNGGNRKLVAQTNTGFLAMNSNYIIYNKENEEGSDYITYIRKLKGTEETPINGSRIFTPMFHENDIYYINQNQVLAKIPIDGGEEEVVLDDTIYNMNLVNDSIYYLNYKDEENQDYTVAIYKLSTQGGEPEIMKDLSNYTSFLNVVEDYVYYMDMDEEQAFINLVNVNDKNEIQLYSWKYNQNSNQTLGEDHEDEVTQ